MFSKRLASLDSGKLQGLEERVSKEDARERRVGGAYLGKGDGTLVRGQTEVVLEDVWDESPSV
jgi:hypothetical protein